MPATDQFSPEDIDALTALHQHLSSIGDPRADKIYKLLPPPPSGTFSLGKTDISFDTGIKSFVRNQLGRLPEYGEAAGLTAAAAATAVAPESAPASPWLYPALTGAGKAIGESIRQFGVSLLRPSWMEHPSLSENLGKQANAAVEGAATGAAALVLGNVTASTPLSSLPIKSRQLVQALNLSDEPIKAAGRMAEAIPDAAAAADRYGASINNASQLKAVASKAVQEFQARIDQFITPEVAKNLIINNNGEIEKEILGGIPDIVSTRDPEIVRGITRKAANFREPMNIEKAKSLLADINQEEFKYYRMSPAEQSQADLKKAHIINQAVGNALRSEMYPAIADVSGEGTAELMRRQGNMIMLRDHAHEVANSEFINPPKGTMRRNITSFFGAASGKPLPIINGVIDYSNSNVNASEMIKDVFRGAFRDVKFPTPAPPAPMVDFLSWPQSPSLSSKVPVGTSKPGPVLPRPANTPSQGLNDYLEKQRFNRRIASLGQERKIEPTGLPGAKAMADYQLGGQPPEVMPPFEAGQGGPRSPEDIIASQEAAKQAQKEAIIRELDRSRSIEGQVKARQDAAAAMKAARKKSTPPPEVK